MSSRSIAPLALHTPTSYVSRTRSRREETSTRRLLYESTVLDATTCKCAGRGISFISKGMAVGDQTRCATITNMFMYEYVECAMWQLRCANTPELACR